MSDFISYEFLLKFGDLIKRFLIYDLSLIINFKFPSFTYNNNLGVSLVILIT